MGSFAVWYYLLVVLPLALEALAGPVLLKQQGLKVVVPVLAVLWVAPVALMHYVSVFLKFSTGCCRSTKRPGARRSRR